MLTGYRIIELGSHIAAPAAAGILSDWGAEVIKIEPRQGDPIRWQRPPAEPNGSSPNFEFDNRGKRSISIDLRQAEARDILHRLIGAADVFISNLRPAPLARAGLDYLTLEALNPRLVYTSVTGFGLEGPAADLPAFDLTAFWARSGLSGQMWPPGTAPASWRPGVGDHICALTAALGTVTALLERVKTGRGRLVECSLLHAGTYVGGFDLAEQLRQGTTMPARRRDEETSRPSCDFALGDGRWITIWAHDPVSDWPKIFAVADRSDLAVDSRFSSAEARAANAQALTRELDKGFALLTLAEVAPRLARASLVWSPIQTAADVLSDEVAEAAGCFVEVDDGRGGAFRAPAAPVRFPGRETRVGPVPKVGEHTDDVLAAFGYGAEALARLRDSGVIA